MIIFAYILVLLASLILSRLRAREITPLIAFIWLSGIIVFLYEGDDLLFDVFSNRISIDGHWLRISNLIAFILGSLLIWTTYPKKRTKTNSSIGNHVAATNYLIFGMVVCVCVRMLVIIVHYGNPLAALPSVRSDFIAGSLRFPVWTSLATITGNLVALNLGMLIGQGFRAHRRVVFFILLALVNDATTADKAGLRFVVMFLLSLYFSRTLISGRQFSNTAYIWSGIFAVCATGLYSTITFFRVNGQGVSIFEVTFKHLYANIVGNYGSSAWFLEHPWPKASFGIYSFPAMYSALGIASVEDHRLADFYNADIVHVGIYNTTDYSAYLYADFGRNGLLFLTLLMGAASSFFFLKARRYARHQDIQVLALVTTGLVVSFRGFYFGAIGFWITLILLYIQTGVRWRGGDKSRPFSK